MVLDLSLIHIWKPISERAFQVTLDGIEKAINKERECFAKKNKTSFEAGIEAKVVQGFLGHYSIAITLDLYTHVTDNKAKSEMDKLQNLYEEIIWKKKRKYKCADFFRKNCPRTVHGCYKQFLYTAKTR